MRKQRDANHNFSCEPLRNPGIGKTHTKSQLNLLKQHQVSATSGIRGPRSWRGSSCPKQDTEDEGKEHAACSFLARPPPADSTERN